MTAEAKLHEAHSHTSPKYYPAFSLFFLTEPFSIFLHGECQQKIALSNSQDRYDYYTENMVPNSGHQQITVS